MTELNDLTHCFKPSCSILYEHHFNYAQWMLALTERYDREKIIITQAEFDEIYDADYLTVMENEDRGT